MATRQTITISLPPEIAKTIERARRVEHRTTSELVREALRIYLTRRQMLPVYTPTKRELRELEKGRAEMRAGEALTIDEFFRHLDSPPSKARPKGRRPRS